MKEDRWMVVDPGAVFGYITEAKPTMDAVSQADFVLHISPEGETKVLKNRWGKAGKVKK